MNRLWLLAAVFLAACDTGPVVNDTLIVDLGGAFSDTLVRVDVDGDLVVEDRVTTGSILATAGVFPVSLPAGRHRVRAVVEGGATGEITVDTGEVVTVVVYYNPDTDAVTFATLTHPPFHR